jgi:hypothetical protein
MGEFLSTPNKEKVTEEGESTKVLFNSSYKKRKFKYK